jgi:hypothetical protein
MQVGASPAGQRRCRMHGGADGSGAPKGSKNGNYKHGQYDVPLTGKILSGLIGMPIMV